MTTQRAPDSPNERNADPTAQLNRDSTDGRVASDCRGMSPAGPSSRSAEEILAGARTELLVIQDFHRLAESIEWELSLLHFQERGSKAFAIHDDHVPFEVNNNGNLSLNAAAVFFESLVEAERAATLEPEIFALELGVGSGLFARFFLDSFRQLCIEHGKDFYDRFCYVATDRSERMLEDLRENGIFSNHEGHYRLVSVNAQEPDADLAHDVALTPHRVRPFRAVFLNYLLDNLPATVLQVDDDQVRELCVRTCLAEGVNLDEYTGLNADEIVARVTSDNPMDRYDLIDLYPLFVLEYNYRPVAVDGVPYGEFAVEFGRQHGQYLLHSYGAMLCIDGLLALLHDQGFILVSDYGQTKPEESAADYLHQRYSGFIAIRLNFALLKAYWIQVGHGQWLEPDEDSGSICTRLLGPEQACL